MHRSTELAPQIHDGRAASTRGAPKDPRKPTGLGASDLVARGFPFGSGQEMTVNIKDRFHHRKLGVE